MNGTPSSVITMGYGTWGSTGLVLTLGYGIGAAAAVYAGRIEYTVGKSLVQYVVPAQRLDYKGKQ